MAQMECNDLQRCAWKVGSNHLIHYAEILPMMHHISAVTFVVRAMPEAITFYTTLGFTLVYSGPENQFTTLQAGDAFVNLTLSPDYTPTWWGRAIFRVDDVDALYETLIAHGLTPPPPQNGAWGERYFHIRDPNGHELSFAQLLQ
jgi:catechol 2,3-dioxygenase-like lactoylglutathione lyase family enzyme